MREELYGLKQSPALFHKLLIQVLAGKGDGDTGLGFKQANTDTCIFYHIDEDNGPVYICAEVDDLVITGGNSAKIAEVKQRLEAEFTTGPAHSVTWEPINSFLGIDIYHDVEAQGS